jgi:hypothetical protein
MADLMMQMKREVEGHVIRLAKSRERQAFT